MPRCLSLQFWELVLYELYFSVIVFSPAISPRQKFDKGLRSLRYGTLRMTKAIYRPKNVREELN